MVKMQYPFDPDNSIYDGLEHEIIPKKIMKVGLNGKPYYVMSYHDLKVNGNLITLLTIAGDMLLKTPLDEEGYKLLLEYVDKHEDMWIDASNFKIKRPIGLTSPLKLGGNSKNK